MATIQTNYPTTSTTAITCTLASLANDSTNLLAGRASTAIDNTTNLDLDHLLSGSVTMSATAPTAGNTVEVWVYAPRLRGTSVAGSTFPDGITGTDAAHTNASINTKANGMRFVQSITVDATASRVYDIATTSIAGLFGGSLPAYWGVKVINGSGQTLSAGALVYDRIRATSA